MAVVINRSDRTRMHGIQQHPHNVNKAEKTASDKSREEIRALYFPNTPIQLSQNVVSTPECSFIFSFNVLKPAMALVNLPPEAVLLGMNTQHDSPNIEQTPPFSANNMSRATLF